MIYFGNFKKFSYSGNISIAKWSDIVVFDYTYVSEILVLLCGDIGMNLNGIDGGEALKQGNEVLIVYHLNFSEALNAS
jgi:hypothetical protein